MKNKRLFNNWQLKLLSVALAVAAWLMIMSLADPSTTATFSNVPITIINDDVFSEAGKAYTIDGRLYTSVRVTGSTSVVRSLSASDFSATADLSKMYDVTGQVPVSVTCTSRSASQISYSAVTSTLKVQIEDLLERTFPVTVETSGTLSDGYLLGSVTANPAVIAVTAPQSVLERIASVRVTVDVGGLTENATVECTPYYYSAIGSQLDFSSTKDIRFSADTVVASIEILTTKTVPVVINVSGQDQVTPGYRYTGAEQSLTTVQVSGLRSRLAALSAITIPEEVLSVAGASADITVTEILTDYLPEGIRLVEGEEKNLIVTLQVEPLVVRTYEVEDVEIIGKNTDYEYIIRNLPLKVQLRALEEDFKAITSDHISAAVTIPDGYGPGEYSLPVTIELDEVFELFGRVNANITIVARGEQIEDKEAGE